jgi:hypothetical protein
MATQVYIENQHTNWTRFPDTWKFTRATLDAPDAYWLATTVWTSVSSPASSKVAVVTGLPEKTSIAWKFAANANDNDVGLARLSGITRLVKDGTTHYNAVYLCTLALTASGKSVESSSIFPQGGDPGWKTVKAIDIDADATILPGLRLVGQGGAWVEMVTDTMAMWGYILQMGTDGGTANDPAGLLALYRPF